MANCLLSFTAIETSVAQSAAQTALPYRVQSYRFNLIPHGIGIGYSSTVLSGFVVLHLLSM